MAQTIYVFDILLLLIPQSFVASNDYVFSLAPYNDNQGWKVLTYVLRICEELPLVSQMIGKASDLSISIF
jgi:hypothetical protein